MMKKEKMPYFSAVLAMGFCVFLLISAEFLPVSLLTPMAKSLEVPEGMVGQAVSISGFFAVISSLLISPLAGKFDRKAVLAVLAAMMTFSFLGAALASNLYMLIIARAILGIVIGGFWALCTAVIMKMVPHEIVPRALGIVYTGNAVAVAFAPPLSSWTGELLGWRFPFWALVPAGAVCVFWLLWSLPEMPVREEKNVSLKAIFSLLASFSILKNMLAVMFSFLGAFASFTYFRVFFEGRAGLSASLLPWAFFALGGAAFLGTSLASRLAGKFLNVLLVSLPILLAAATMALLECAASFLGLFAVLILWGGLNAAIPVAWSSWLARDVKENPEAGGGLMVAVIQCAIMCGGISGGFLLDRFGIGTVFLIGSLALLLSALLVIIPAKQTDF